MESHGKWRELWKSHGILTICFRKKNYWAAKINKTDGKSRVWQKMQPKCAIFRQKIWKIFWGGGCAPFPDPTPTGREIPLTSPPRYIFVHLLFGFFGIARIKVVMESINLVWKSHVNWFQQSSRNHGKCSDWSMCQFSVQKFIGQGHVN